MCIRDRYSTTHIEQTDKSGNIRKNTKTQYSVILIHSLTYLQIADMVEKAARGGSQCVVLGGDHSMSIGSIAGHARVHSEFGIIWIDAHADINPPTMSPSGNAHGMPLAFLARTNFEI